VRLDASTSAALGDLARSGHVTLATLVQAAWAIVLARYSGRSDVALGVTTSGRPTDLEGVEEMVGVFINTLPLRVLVDEEAPLLPWLRTVQERLVAQRRFEATPLVKVHKWSDVPRGRPLFESLVIVQNTPVDPGLMARGPLGFEDARVYDQTNYPLTVAAVPGDRLTLRIGFDARRFDAAAVGRMLGHLATLLGAMARWPGRRVAELSMLSEVEHGRLVEGWSDGDRETPFDGARPRMGEATR
jgi:non-ribosomal peptide synthetase component F